MSSIRPLATITLLAAMGIFLYLKINERPESATSPAPAEWEDAPKIEFVSSATTGAPSAESAAPAFTPSAPALATPAPNTAAPALPAMPPISAPAAENAPPSEPLTAPPTDATSAPLADTATSDINPSETSAPPAATDVAPATETAEAGVPAAEPPATTPPGLPPIPELPPLPESNATTATPGPVAPVPPDTAAPVASEPAATTAPSSSPFDAARPAINAALSQGELARAHLLLSEWYNAPDLSPAENDEVQTLLNQLAGTVIYSNEHRLEPAYTVQAGETLETIAEKHHVPWQLLAKINGIASATAIQPGQTIKVVRGPFMGVVDVSDAELTLTIDGRFAGKYAVQLDGAATGEGEWTVTQKQLEPATVAPTPPTMATPIDRRLVLQCVDNANSTVVIAATTAPTVGGTPPQGTIRIAAEQSEDLYDILSVGSRVVIRR